LVKDSLTYKNEIESIVEIQKTAKKSDIKEAALERDLTTEMIAQDVDFKLSRKDFPELYKLLDRSNETTEAIVRETKNYWKTTRPFLASSKVKALIKPSNNWAYPSGHTTSSYVAAQILSILIPTKNSEFKERAQEIAKHRLLVGMHFPHDLEGGKQLSFLIIGSLLQNEEFNEDLKLAKEELAEKYFAKEKENAGEE